MASRSLLVGGPGSSAPRAHDHGNVPAITTVRRALDTTVTTGDDAVTFDTEIEDELSAWVSGSPTQLVTPTAGLYRIEFQVIWDNGNTDGNRFTRIMVNGTRVAQSGFVAHDDVNSIMTNQIYRTLTLAAADVITFRVGRSLTVSDPVMLGTDSHGIVASLARFRNDS